MIKMTNYYDIDENIIRKEVNDFVQSIFSGLELISIDKSKVNVKGTKLIKSFSYRFNFKFKDTFIEFTYKECENTLKAVIPYELACNATYFQIYKEKVETINKIFNGEYTVSENIAYFDINTNHVLFVDNLFSEIDFAGDPIPFSSYIRKNGSVNKKPVLFTHSLLDNLDTISYYKEGFRKDSKSGRSVSSPKLVGLKNKPLEDMAEKCLYDLYLKKEHDIKYKSKREMEVIKMIRY